MAKKLFYVLFTLLLVLSFGYFFIHDYSEATCTEPMTCRFCHKTIGEPLGHDFTDPTCTEDAVCLRCNETGEKATGHNYLNITPTLSICENCQNEEGYLEEFDTDLCSAYLVYNLNFDYTVYSKNSDKKRAPASLTKLLTVCIAMDTFDLNEKIKVGSEIELLKPNSSTAHLKIGQVLTLYQLLEACLLPSGNDAAYVLAFNVVNKLYPDTYTKSKAIVKFTEIMNAYAKNLGCINSNFETPDGYDSENHYSTADDLLLIAKHAISYEAIRSIVQKVYVEEVIEDGTVFQWHNSNNMLYEEEYAEYITGLKTGYTGKAGRCIIITTEKDGIDYLIICLGSDDIEKRTQAVTEMLEQVYS